MQGILLDRNVSVWRKKQSGTGAVWDYNDTLVYPNIQCAIVPVSRFDLVSPYAAESTHIVWVEYWIDLRKEDEIYDGRRPLDAEGDPPQQFIFTINGIQRFSLGIPQRTYYARERD